MKSGRPKSEGKYFLTRIENSDGSIISKSEQSHYKIPKTQKFISGTSFLRKLVCASEEIRNKSRKDLEIQSIVISNLEMSKRKY